MLRDSGGLHASQCLEQRDERSVLSESDLCLYAEFATLTAIWVKPIYPIPRPHTNAVADLRKVVESGLAGLRGHMLKGTLIHAIHHGSSRTRDRLPARQALRLGPHANWSRGLTVGLCLQLARHLSCLPDGVSVRHLPGVAEAGVLACEVADLFVETVLGAIADGRVARVDKTVVI